MTWTCPATFDVPASPPGGHLTIDTSRGALPAVPLADAAGLLDRLLVLHWLGGVTDDVAAKLVGIRKADFAELADVRLVERGLQRASLNYFKRAFRRQFPWTDPAAWKHAKHATKKRGPCTHARAPTKRDIALLTPPQRHTLRELVPSPRRPDAEVARYLETHRVPVYRRFPDPSETGPEIEMVGVK